MREDDEKIELFKINKEVRSHEYQITLSDSIEGPPFAYAELAHTLREEVREEDKVTIFLANYGGCCDSAVSIINAISDCQGEVKVVVTAPSYSAATFIALAADELELKPFSYLMFHNFSTAEEGKAGELKAAVLNGERQVHTLMKQMYKDFLTKAEIGSILNDKDVYIHWDDSDLGERLARKFKTEEE